MRTYHLISFQLTRTRSILVYTWQKLCVQISEKQTVVSSTYSLGVTRQVAVSTQVQLVTCYTCMELSEYAQEEHSGLSPCICFPGSGCGSAVDFIYKHIVHNKVSV